MVKNKKKFGAQTFGLIALSLMLVASLVLGLTGAWFSDTKNGSAEITFGTISLGTFTVQGTYTNVLPGDDLKSLGGATYTGSADAYYRVTYTLTDAVNAGIALENEIVYGMFGGSGEDATLTTTTDSITFDTLALPADTIGNDYQGQTVTVTIKVDVIQARNQAGTFGDANAPTDTEYAAINWNDVEAL